jgi:outer membrane protein TolC
MQQAVLTVKRWERDIMREIDDDIKQAQASFERVAATRAAREYAEDALNAEEKKLEQGKSTTYTVLQMQRDLTAARGAEIQALDNYNKNLSQLSLDEGTTLSRLGIQLDVQTQIPFQ